MLFSFFYLSESTQYYAYIERTLVKIDGRQRGRSRVHEPNE